MGSPGFVDPVFSFSLVWGLKETLRLHIDLNLTKRGPLESHIDLDPRFLTLIFALLDPSMAFS